MHHSFSRQRSNVHYLVETALTRPGLEFRLLFPSLSDPDATTFAPPPAPGDQHVAGHDLNGIASCHVEKEEECLRWPAREKKKF